MQSERWWQDSSITAELFQRPKSFEFIQATRLLRHSPANDACSSWTDHFKFETSFNLNFPATEIESLELVDERVHLTNLIVGLTGIKGALPYTYTNKIKQAPRQQRAETKEFLSLFNHKLTSQYVESSITYHLPVRYEIENKNDYLDILHALNGYVRSQHQQQDLDEYFAEFSGLMQGQNNTVHALKTMLSCIFKHEITIKEFIQESFKLASDQLTTLGGSQPSLLGINTFCGETIQQIDGKIEIQIGPLKRQQYLKFLPHQELSLKLKKIVETWCSPTLSIDLRLILDESEIQPVRLTQSQESGLGQGAFLMSRKPSTHSHETCYSLIGEQI
ncbi:type VI secretion system baseplate subunit TssG [Acinetobacter seifertii]|uniref:type VI secretion system baseplate subunit TssG n=1 Tax=Acinetobacter seifertii TaxID=1530123 RepID=UPI001580F8EB|nr:type VI secretion system baseplate subunit TssG [Acinetobacter seifertii]NUF83760.1 type VI secretion system baseplate subunit TssG [Acinetobacter seifertii]